MTPTALPIVYTPVRLMMWYHLSKLSSQPALAWDSLSPLLKGSFPEQAGKLWFENHLNVGPDTDPRTFS